MKKKYWNSKLGEEWIRYGYADGFIKKYIGNGEMGEPIMNNKQCSKEEYEEHYEMERTSHRAGRMVLDALKEGKIDEVKQFLVEMYETYVIPQQGQQYVYQPEITVENWDEMWNKVMRNE